METIPNPQCLIGHWRHLITTYSVISWPWLSLAKPKSQSLTSQSCKCEMRRTWAQVAPSKQTNKRVMPHQPQDNVPRAKVRVVILNLVSYKNPKAMFAG